MKSIKTQWMASVLAHAKLMPLEVFLTILISLVSLDPLEAGDHNPHTNWLQEARFGLMMHVLPGSKEQLDIIKNFDVETLAEQLEAAGAAYFLLTLGQNSGFMNSPNSTYDRMAGYQPGERCSTRDLPLDLYKALKPRNIRLMLYLPCQTPCGDARAQKAFGLAQGNWNQSINMAFAEKWAEVIYHWSARYGDKISGWWFDGGYQNVGFNNSIAQAYGKAVKRGNAQTIVTFNPGITLIRWTKAEDYTAGELNEPFKHLPTGRWLEGSQWHTLSYLGSDWFRRDTRYPAEKWAQWVKNVVAKKGVVTLDVGPNWNSAHGPIGSISGKQMTQLKTIRKALFSHTRK
ncbi:MAG: alpha-L-fucosidase [Planctomycetes bacterium]|nr:alpha-L-fucosidase [Planctomycetota bacterium]